jgi:hypothetical protein
MTLLSRNQMAKMEKMTTTQKMMKTRVVREEDAAYLLAEDIIKQAIFLLKLPTSCPIPSTTTMRRCWMREIRQICRSFTIYSIGDLPRKRSILLITTTSLTTRRIWN